MAGRLRNIFGEQIERTGGDEYIKNQRVHHINQTFEEAYLSLLKLHGVEFDERFVFD
jgi:hypothetical protein